MTNQFPVTGVRAFHYHFKKGIIRFDFGTPIPIRISPEECLALCREEKKYKIREEQVYLCSFSMRRMGHLFFYLMWQRSGEILKWGPFFEVLGANYS